MTKNPLDRLLCSDPTIDEHVMIDDSTSPILTDIKFRLSRYHFINRHWSIEEKEILRPIAETLAMLDGNAFFGTTKDDSGDDTFYEQYLPEAASLFISNGGLSGWAGEVSWLKDTMHESDAVRDAYINWKTIKKLTNTSR